MRIKPKQAHGNHNDQLDGIVLAKLGSTAGKKCLVKEEKINSTSEMLHLRHLLYFRTSIYPGN